MKKKVGVGIAVLAVLAVVGISVAQLTRPQVSKVGRHGGGSQATQDLRGSPPTEQPQPSPSTGQPAPAVSGGQPPPETGRPGGPFTFNWIGDPGSPLPWTPGATNDWDLVASNNLPSDLMSESIAAQHGADCSPPPATHQVIKLTDSAFICKNHMMTSIADGYGTVYFSPARLVDFSKSSATVTWQVSTQRLSARDWWDVWISPFNENLVLPLDNDFPAFQGPPKDAVHIRMDFGTCARGNAGSIFTAEVFTNFVSKDATQAVPCIEDIIKPSAVTRSSFELDISTSHLRFAVPGTSLVWVDTAVNLPFNQGVVQWGHHTYNPDKGCIGAEPCGDTFHWSNVSISPAVAFTMLRANGIASVHGAAQTLRLPQAAPAGSFLRFAGLGEIGVSFDGGRTWQAARRQQQEGTAPEHFSSYWTPVPAGSTSVTLNGQPNVFGEDWWVQDVAVWSRGP